PKPPHPFGPSEFLWAAKVFRRGDARRSRPGDRRDVRPNSTSVAMADGKLPAKARRQPPIRGLSVLARATRLCGGVQLRIRPSERRPARDYRRSRGRGLRIRGTREVGPAPRPRGATEQRRPPAGAREPWDGHSGRVALLWWHRGH